MLSTVLIILISQQINNRARILCQRAELKYNEDTLGFDGPGIGKHCLFMFLEFIVYFIITILIEVCCSIWLLLLFLVLVYN